MFEKCNFTECHLPAISLPSPKMACQLPAISPPTPCQLPAISVGEPPPSLQEGVYKPPPHWSSGLGDCDKQQIDRITKMTTNLKPADELLTIRNRIKALQAREAELKAGMQSGDLPLEGDFAIACLSVRATKRFDRKAAEAKVGDLSAFDVAGETTAPLIEELVQELAE